MNLGHELRAARQRLRRLTPTTPRGRFPSLAWAWPTGGRDLLLRASTLHDLERAAACYHEWQETHDFNEVDFGLQRLLVAISARIPDDLLAPKERARLRGIERMLWSRCMIALKATTPALAALEAAGIDVMIFKGAVRTVLDMSSLRGRYAAELDMLVRPADFERAWQAVRGAGWKYVLGYEPDLARLIGANLSKPKAGELDLHKYAYHQLVASDAKPEALWGRSIRTSFLGHPVHVPSPTDRVMMAIAHGGFGGHDQSDWLVDCALLISGGEVDWALLEQMIAERKLEGFAAVALSYLAGPLEQEVPPEVLARLKRRLRFHPYRRADALLQSRPKMEHGVASALGRALTRGIRVASKARMIARIEALRGDG